MSDTVRYVSESGELIGEMPLAAEELITCYRAMRRARHFDDRAVTLQRQGRLGVYPLFRGQEAAQVGAALALGPDDWLVPTYRETAAAITHGMPLSTALLYWRAHPAGWSFPEDLRILPFYVPIATQLPHAVGLAHASTLRGEDAVVLAFVGDGGTSEGDAHEALNFASVFSAPVVFVVQNNGWAISVPTERQMRNTRIADRAVGYGMPGVRVDGNDLVAMLHVMREAVARARESDSFCSSELWRARCSETRASVEASAAAPRPRSGLPKKSSATETQPISNVATVSEYGDSRRTCQGCAFFTRPPDSRSVGAGGVTAEFRAPPHRVPAPW